MDALTISLIFQGVIIALYTWLFYDTRRAAQARDARNDQREKELLAVSQTLSNQLIPIANSLQKMEMRLEQIDRKTHINQ